METIVLIRPTEQLESAAKQALQKFRGIFDSPTKLFSCKNSSELAKYVEQGGRVGLVCVATVMELNDLNALVVFWSRSRRRPYVVVPSEMVPMINNRIPREFLEEAKGGFTKEFVYSCLRQYLDAGDRKIDIRVMKHVLLSVVNVIAQNTQERLTPLPPQEIKNEANRRDISSVTGFLGDGIKGTITVATSKSLLRKFGEKMLFCPSDQVTDDMIEDLMCEISNQIMGVFRQALTEYKYDLASTMQLVVNGSQHLHQSSTSGRYFSLPFRLGPEEFNLQFCYDTYNTSMLPRKVTGGDTNILDVRLVNLVIEAVESVLGDNTQGKVARSRISKQQGISYKSHSIHMAHCRGDGGGITMALDVSDTAAKLVLRKMLGCSPGQMTPEMIADIMGELLNQVMGNFKFRAEQFGYQFHNIFLGGFVAGEGMASYLLRNAGHYMRVGFTLDGCPFTFCFGMDSKLAPPIFNLWDYIAAQRTA